MCDEFDRDFWAVSMLRGARVYPAAWNASVAIGAMVQQLELRRHGVSGYQQQQYETTALLYCNKTARLLVEVNHTHMDASEREMLLLACILLMAYANLRGDFAQAIVHITNGVYLSKQWDYWQQNKQRSFRLPNCVVPVSSINMFFRRLEMQLISSPSPLPERLNLSNQPIHIVIDDCYHSALEAYIELLPITNAYYHIVTQSQSSQTDNQRHMINTDAIATLQKPFLLWRNSFHAYKAVIWGRQADQQDYANESDCIQTLTVLELVLTFVLCADPSKEELTYDDFSHEFYSAMDILEYLLDVSPFGNAHRSGTWIPNMSSFISFVGQALSAICAGCRIPTIRRRGLRLLMDYPFKDGTTDSTFLAGFLRMKMDLEESGWQRVPIAGGCKCVRDVFICGNHRIQSPTIRRENGGSRVTLRNLYEVEHELPGFSMFVPTKGKDVNKG